MAVSASTLHSYCSDVVQTLEVPVELHAGFIIVIIIKFKQSYSICVAKSCVDRRKIKYKI